MSAPEQLVSQSILSQLQLSVAASDVQLGETLQALWSGYGCIVRVHFSEPDSTAILKLVKPPALAKHPRGWNTTASHERKVRSYQIEAHWYQTFASRCDQRCKVPLLLACGSDESVSWMLLEDLSVDYPDTAHQLSLGETGVCLDWLACFHAKFVGTVPTGLWSTGTYWHLDTRADELKAMPEGKLKEAAVSLDHRLNACQYKTLVHGDAKIANFLFNKQRTVAAAVDFQYVGGGVGSKDLAYFLGSCLDEHTLLQHEDALLERYFSTLNHCLQQQHSATFAASVVASWRELYAIAWTDFYRFLQGWMPEHKKINRYTRQLADQAFTQL